MITQLRSAISSVVLQCLALLCLIVANAYSLDLKNQFERHPLDDTGGFIHFSPTLSHVLACDTFHMTVSGTFTDARVWSLNILLESPLVLLAVDPGSDPRLNLMPEMITGDTLLLDGFFHPNLSGNTVLATLTLTTTLPPQDDTARVGFFSGRGFSGTADAPEPIQFDGDTAYVFIEATPPHPPAHVIIDVLPAPAHDDSILILWNRVFYDLDDDTLISPLYQVYLTDVINSELDTIQIGSTADTFYYSTYVQNTYQPGDTGAVNAGVFQVRTRKTQP